MSAATGGRGAGVRTFASKDDLARAMVDMHERAARDAIAARGFFTVALTGGSAALLYGALVKAALPWDKTHVFFGDERCVPPDHADSNYRLAKEQLLDQVPAAHVHRMRGEIPPKDAADEYERDLVATTNAEIDLLHLGLGPDGHVCSLFPGHPLLREKTRLVSFLTDSPKPPPSRLTFTLPTIAKARAVLFLALGASKADPVRAAITEPTSNIPCALVHRMGTATWLADQDAASKLSSTSP